MFRKQKTLLSVSLVAAGLITFATLSADDPPIAVRTRSAASDAAPDFMHAKLKATHEIIDGLAFEDFPRIERGATELISVGDKASWKVRRNPMYMGYATDFEQTAIRLRDAARSRSVEKATFAYMHLTVSCTACHRHVRNVTQVAPTRGHLNQATRPTLVR